MSEKRFTVMKKFDGSYVICDKGKMLVADDCCDLLNTLSDDIEEVEISIKLFEDDVQIKDKKISEQQATIEELRLQEKEKGVPVFVVREGKNPIALFFNEQRASLYCQENMANLTYQQEKWCRVE